MDKPRGSWWSRKSQAFKGAALSTVGVVGTLGTLILPHLGGDDQSFDGCGLEGLAKQGQWQWTANPLKNRSTVPSDEVLDASATLDSLSKGGPSAFKDTSGGEIEGYVVEVKLGGTESCNCGSTQPPDMDTHIYIGPTADAPKTKCVIVEVTPRLRATMATQNIDWSTGALESSLTGWHVSVSGWLFYDKEHEASAMVTNPNGRHNWRASCWEIHPVTDIQILH